MDVFRNVIVSLSLLFIAHQPIQAQRPNTDFAPAFPPFAMPLKQMPNNASKNHTSGAFNPYSDRTIKYINSAQAHFASPFYTGPKTNLSQSIANAINARQTENKTSDLWPMGALSNYVTLGEDLDVNILLGPYTLLLIPNYYSFNTQYKTGPECHHALAAMLGLRFKL